MWKIVKIINDLLIAKMFIVKRCCRQCQRNLNSLGKQWITFGIIIVIKTPRQSNCYCSMYSRDWNTEKNKKCRLVLCTYLQTAYKRCGNCILEVLRSRPTQGKVRRETKWIVDNFRELREIILETGKKTNEKPIRIIQQMSDKMTNWQDVSCEYQYWRKQKGDITKITEDGNKTRWQKQRYYMAC